MEEVKLEEKVKDNPFSFFKRNPDASAGGKPTKKTKSPVQSEQKKPVSASMKVDIFADQKKEKSIFDDDPLSSAASTKNKQPSTPATKKPPRQPSIFDDGEDPLSVPSISAQRKEDPRPPLSTSKKRTTPPATPPLRASSGEGDDLFAGSENGKKIVDNPYSFSKFQKHTEKPSESEDAAGKKNIGNSNGAKKKKEDEEEEDDDEVTVGGLTNPFSFKTFTEKHNPTPAATSSEPSTTNLKPKDSAPSSRQPSPMPTPPTPQQQQHQKQATPIIAADLPDIDLDYGAPQDHLQHESIEEAKQLKKRVAKMEERMKAMEAAYRQEQEKARQAEARAAKAEEGVARLKRKEQRETQQLQEMVQGVERNLHLTTTRAEKAERRIAELESMLQKCSCGRQGAGGGGTGGDAGQYRERFDAIQSNTKVLRGELHKAAVDAEEGIKKLVAGAATLREIAQLLNSIDKMSTVG